MRKGQRRSKKEELEAKTFVFISKEKSFKLPPDWILQGTENVVILESTFPMYGMAAAVT